MVAFHALTLKLPIQTTLSVAPKLQVCTRSGEKMSKIQENEPTLAMQIIHGQQRWTSANAFNIFDTIFRTSLSVK